MATESDFGQGKPDPNNVQLAGGVGVAPGASVDLSIEPFLLFDENLNCVSINSAVQKLFGISEADVVGKNILEVVPNIDGEGAYNRYQNIMRAGESSVSDARMGDLRFSLKAFKLGNGLGIILSDISEQKQAENDGYEVEQRLDLAGRLVALGELAENVARELNTLAGEQVALEEFNAGRRSERGGNTPDAKAGFHSREFTSYLREFKRAMSHIVGAGEMAALEESYLHMARTLAIMAETREPYARGHSERVSVLASEIAVWLGCPADQIKEIQVAAMLHDIGKIVIPDYILYKPGQLTLAEYSEIKRHPAATIEILGNLNHFDSIMPVIESHHEWYNGNGYPNRLKEDNIHLGSRILAVADAYDAMTSPRPHRSRLSDREAVQVIESGAGTQWDPMIVHAFLEILGPEFERLHAVVGKRVEGEERWVAPERKEASSKANEALERAEHWARWMECTQDSQQGRGKAS